MSSDPPRTTNTPGGVVHTYQRYDPVRFPPPTAPPGSAVDSAFDHMLTYGSMRGFTEQQLAEAIHLDPSQIKGLGPSLESLIAKLEERKRRILETYETKRVLASAGRAVAEAGAGLRPPERLQRAFDRAIREEQLHDLERLWSRVRDPNSPFGVGLLHLAERMGEKYEIEALASKYDFTGRKRLSIDEAIEVKETLESIDRLLEQLREAMKTAQLAIIDLDALSEYVEGQDVDDLRGLQQQVEEIMRDLAERQGLERGKEGFRLTPKAFKMFQNHLLSTIFADLEAGRRGRHDGPIVGEGAVEMPQTRPYEFGDSVVHMDIPQSVTNMLIREGGAMSGQLRPDDIEIHDTRNTPKCATAVIIDMSGSMRYGGQYIHAKRMALGLHGLIRSEYPGDFLQVIEMATFAKAQRITDVPALMPKPVTIYDPVVRLRADMSDPEISESDVPPHFTNIQHALLIARRVLAAQDTPNRQIVLITDGLPTAHFEEEQLYLLYPPHQRTEEATMREAHACGRDSITINLFLVPSWSQTQEDVQFAHRLAESTKGRVIFTGGDDLDRFVVWDYVAQRRRIIG
jgi:uncharacterized protein with von Willebrand factor type A (vWA) domain